MSSVADAERVPRKDTSATQGSLTVGSEDGTDGAVNAKMVSRDTSSSNSSTNSSVLEGRSPRIGALGTAALTTSLPLVEEKRFLSKSFWLLSTSHPIRAFCIAVISNRWYNLFILLSIIVNSIFLAINDPLKGTREGFNAVNHYADYVFLAIFASEALLKIIAMGFVLHPRSYLRDLWNWIDGIVVILAAVGAFSSAGNLTGLRALRLLRPLRTVSRVRGMRIIVNSLLKGAQNCLSVLLLVVVVYIIFGGAATQLWSGVLRNNCYNDSQIVNGVPAYPNEITPPATRFCSRSLDGFHCPKGSTCLPAGKNPGCGYLNFDDIGHTWLTMYIVMTFDDWPRTMYRLQDAWSNEAFIWFLLFTFVTVFFILNLTLASVEESFSDERDAAVAEEQAKKKKAADLRKQLRAQGMSKQQANAAAQGGGIYTLWFKIKAMAPKKHTIWYMPDNRVSHALREMFKGKIWEWVIIVSIVANVVILAMDHYPQSKAWDHLQSVSNVIFTIIFGIEMVLKLIALGPFGYVIDPFNILDGFLVISSIIDLAASFVNFKAFRVVRLLRVARLFNKVGSMQVILLMVRKSLSSLFYITLVLLFFLFIFSVLGRQLFAGSLQPPPLGAPAANCAGLPGAYKPRSNFDSFWEAFVTVFQIAIYDDWSKTMYQAMSATSNWAVIFFLALTLCSTFIFNLFVAMLMHAFEDAQEEINEIKEGKRKMADDLDNSSQSSASGASSDGEDERSEQVERKRMQSLLQIKIVGGKVELQMLDQEDVNEHEERIAKEGGFKIGLPRPVNRVKRIPAQLSLNIWAPSHPVRNFCVKVAGSKTFAYVVLFMIVLSCIFLALDQPFIRNSSSLGKTILAFNYIFVVFFVVEIVLRVVALGLYQHKGAYLRDPWNVLDVVVAILTIISLPVPALRLFRAFRAIRILTQFERTRVVLMAFIRALVPIGNILAVVAVVWLVFAILGVQLWKGTFADCNDKTIEREVNCTGTYISPLTNLTTARKWITPIVNFNNVGQAEDAVGIGKAPVTYHKPGAAAYFMTFTIIGGFFTLSMFVAALINQFQDQAKEVNGSAFLDEKQNLWLLFSRIAATASPLVKPRKPTNQIRRWCFDSVQSPLFDPAMMVFIGLNVFVILTVHFPSTVEWERFWQVGNYFFLVLFAVEAALKIIGLGPKLYFKEPWNIFDFVIVMLTIAGGVAEVIADVPGSPSFLRALRSIRMLRIVRFVPKLRVFVDTLVFTLPSVFNVLMLFCVVWFIFAIIAMNLMGDKIPLCDICNFNARSSFDTFGKSLLTVFVLLTAEGWSVHMTEAAAVNTAYYVYYLALIVCVMLVLLNLFIAVLMEEFSSFKDARHERLKLSSFEDFAALWAKRDPYGEKRIRALDLVPLLWALGEPLGFSPTMTKATTFAALELMDVPIYADNSVRYEHVLQGLIRWGLVLNMKNIRFKYQSRDITRYTVAHLYATQTLQRVFKRRRVLKQVAAALKEARRQNLLSSHEDNDKKDKKHKKHRKHKKDKEKRKIEESERRAKERADAIAQMEILGERLAKQGEDTEPIASPKRHVRRPV